VNGKAVHPRPGLGFGRQVVPPRFPAGIPKVFPNGEDPATQLQKLREEYAARCGSDAPQAERDAIPTGEPRKCEVCPSELPDGRTRFCSDACLAEGKRRAGRLGYGHKHAFVCQECGQELNAGRHRK
jgi:hypothetical protein